MGGIYHYWSVLGTWAVVTGFGLVSLVGGVYAPSPRPVLIALGVTGVFAGVLAYLVTPQNFVRVSIVECLHAVLVRNVMSDLPCSERQVKHTYIPCTENAPGNGSVLLSVSCGDQDEDPGKLIYPTGDGLLADIDDKAVQDLSDVPMELGHQIVDCLENGLGFVESAAVTVTTEDRQATVEITGDVVGVIGRVDDPVTSFVGSALASGLDRPVTVETVENGSGRFTISCQWEDMARREYHLQRSYLTPKAPRLSRES